MLSNTLSIDHSTHIHGTDGNDTLTGTNGHDVIRGEGGDDLISGLGGPDTLMGGHGNDTIPGGDGNDLINGGAGNDSLSGGAGNDVIYGGNGHDTLDGGTGRDVLLAGVGDTVVASDGNDTLVFAVDGHNKHVHDSRGYIGTMDATGMHGNDTFDWAAFKAIGLTADNIHVHDGEIDIVGTGDHGEKVDVTIDIASDAHFTLWDGHSASPDHLYDPQMDTHIIGIADGSLLDPLVV